MTKSVLVARAILAIVIGSFLAPVAGMTTQQSTGTYPAEWYAAGLHDSGNRYTGPGTQTRFEWDSGWSPLLVAFTEGGEGKLWEELLVLETGDGARFNYWSPKWTRDVQEHNPFWPDDWISANGLGRTCAERGKALWLESFTEDSTQSGTVYSETTEGLLVYLDGWMVYLEAKNVVYAWSAGTASFSAGGGGVYFQSSVRLVAPPAQFVEVFTLAQEQIWRGRNAPFRLLTAEQASDAVNALFEANAAPCGIAPRVGAEAPAAQESVSSPATNPLGEVTWIFNDASNTTWLPEPVDVGMLWACFDNPVAQTTPPYTARWFHNGVAVAEETKDPGERLCFGVHYANGGILFAGQWRVQISDANGLITVTPLIELSSTPGESPPPLPGLSPTPVPRVGTCAPHPATGEVPEGCDD